MPRQNPPKRDRFQEVLTAAIDDMMEQRFYVYVIFRPDGSPCYVGKGRGRRWRSHAWRSHNTHLQRIYKKSTQELPVVLVREGLTETAAFEVEVALIAAIGREVNAGPLVNQTDGGEGTAGASVVFTPGRKAKIATANLGNKSHFGHSHSRDTKAVLSAKSTGNKNAAGYRHTDEARQKMRVARAKQVLSEETRSKRSASLKLWHSQNTAPAKGYRHTDEALKRIGEASHQRRRREQHHAGA